MSLTLRPFGEADAECWDAFVRAFPEGTFFHLAGWRQVIAEAFGHREHYTIAERSGQIVGVMPLFHLKSHLFANGLISVPFCVYGGPLALDEETRKALDDHAVALMGQVGADFVEFRSRVPSRADWVCRDDLYFDFRKPIAEDADAILKSIPRKQRAVVRKVIDAGEVSDAVEDNIDNFYRAYAEGVRDHGTPIFGKRYFQKIVDVFGDAVEIRTVKDADGRVLNSVMSFYYGDEIHLYYAGGAPDAKRRGTVHYLYWRAMCGAREKGYSVCNFGRSKAGSGGYDMKSHWKCDVAPLTYEFRLKEGKTLPDFNPLNPKYRLQIAIWRRLPLPVANLVGPFVARNLG
ncbi:FemAB family XrtA/PEP-CTERM system-associated protein [Oceanibacterium hippocampi]|uniref:FemAB family protein n=1 Tax=Oceanibacterium hippocampi TaxID=745714 RepID=A0A1Y5TVF4_9PROT|nr:FemAB family XrtA/PEP-CTERM system-associated protein [Oceanibacterium hippocampi]SLN69078.1 FemAB family protein [Oceanibacterium hippocampi]